MDKVTETLKRIDGWTLEAAAWGDGDFGWEQHLIHREDHWFELFYHADTDRLTIEADYGDEEDLPPWFVIMLP